MAEINRKEITEIIKRLPAYTRLMYQLFRDPSIRKRHKALLMIAIGYAISPIDIIPGFIPVIGQIDDIIVMLSVIKKVLNRVGARKAEELLAKNNLTYEMLNQDLAAANRAASILAFKAGKATFRGARFLANSSWKVARRLWKR